MLIIMSRFVPHGIVFIQLLSNQRLCVENQIKTPSYRILFYSISKILPSILINRIGVFTHLNNFFRFVTHKILKLRPPQEIKCYIQGLLKPRKLPRITSPLTYLIIKQTLDFIIRPLGFIQFAHATSNKRIITSFVSNSVFWRLSEDTRFHLGGWSSLGRNTIIRVWIGVIASILPSAPITHNPRGTKLARTFPPEITSRIGNSLSHTANFCISSSDILTVRDVSKLTLGISLNHSTTTL
ncbi:Transposase [Pseudomonas syringae pv. actinidiae]|uniref:Transposase n=1 Tax=Pseudomonas syringae pv. actinidiae TaxID=103796 RepID=A0A2V0QM58_PSESF|nr:Transposase [Pseudomonas syringae pv. actinidiae]